MVDIGLITAYVLIVLCALSAILIPLIQSFSDPKSLVKSGIGLGAVLVVFLIGYALAGSDSEGTTAATSKLVGAGIISMYIFVLIAIVGILFTELSKLFK
ncbi:MAG: hypothetical protein ACFHWX_02950 [Bacteroidota bacterium]